MSPPVVGSPVSVPSDVVPLLVGVSVLDPGLVDIDASVAVTPEPSVVAFDTGEQPPTSATPISEIRKPRFFMILSG